MLGDLAVRVAAGGAVFGCGLGVGGGLKRVGERSPDSPIGLERRRGRALPSWAGACFRDLGEGCGFHWGSLPFRPPQGERMGGGGLQAGC
jgi:hypothetical protein